MLGMARKTLGFIVLSGMSSALVVWSIASLAYLWQIWDARGLSAGVIGVGGHTLPSEKLLLVVSALGLPTFTALSVVFIVLLIRTRGQRRIFFNQH